MDKIARFTRATDEPDGAEPRMPGQIVIVTPGGSLEDGFALAVDGLVDGPVRLIGMGATLEAQWPSWVRRRNLTVTELGAYCATSRTEENAELRGAVERWLDTCVPPIAGAAASRVLFGAAVARVFEPWFRWAPVVAGLLEAHPGVKFHIVGPATPFVELLLGGGGDVVGASHTPPTRAFRTRLLLYSPMLGFGAGVRTLSEKWRSRGTIRALRAFDAEQRPRLWLALSSNWWRLNRHLIGGLGDRHSLGVLLIGSLAPGERTETARGSMRGTATLAGLGPLRARKSIPVEQATRPATKLGLLRALGCGTALAARAVAGIARADPELHFSGIRASIAGQPWSVAKLATVDVIRGVLAAAAAAELSNRRVMSGNVVVFAASQPAEIACCDAQLRSAGATTLEYRHGSIGDDWGDAARSSSSLVCVWAVGDAVAVRETGGRVAVAGVPATSLGQRAHTGSRVLFLTNYLHWDLRVGNRYPMAAYQDEINRAITMLHDCAPHLALRWRPHPADDPEIVQSVVARMRPYLDVSQARPLAEDLAWCDVLVSSPSSAIVEALAAGVTTFAHVPPEWEGVRTLSSLPEERRFFRAEQLVPSLLSTLSLLDAEPSAVVAIDDAVQTAMFGGSGGSRTLASLVDDLLCSRK